MTNIEDLEAIQDQLNPFLQRSSVRHFSDRKISEGILEQLLNCAIQTPTSSHEQTFALINVVNPILRQSLASLCDDQAWMIDCSHLFVICADLNKLSCWLDVPVDEINPDVKLAAIIDASLVGMTLSLSAEAIGLGSVMIGAVRNQTKETIKLLNLPKGVFPLFALCLGYYDYRKKPKPRLPVETLVFEDQYQLTSSKASDIDEYHQGLINYYNQTIMEHPIFRQRAKEGTWLDWMRYVGTAKYREAIHDDLRQQGYDL